MTCPICLAVAVSLESCVRCNRLYCSECFRANELRCCHCLGAPASQLALARQLVLLNVTRQELKQEPPDAGANFKQCPVCLVWTERVDGCSQLYCIGCQTVWNWNTLQPETRADAIHVPDYYASDPLPVALSDLRLAPLAQRAVAKCLQILAREPASYATDCYTLRLLYLNDLLTFQEFKAKILERFQAFETNLRLKSILESGCDETELTALNPRWCVSDTCVLLPYV